MAIDQHKPPALRVTLTLTKEELEQQLWSAYRLGRTAGETHAQPPQAPLMPMCPTHNIPLWIESRAGADGSWLYCAFCRQDARGRQTDALKKLPPRKIRLENTQAEHWDDWHKRQHNTLTTPCFVCGTATQIHCADCTRFYCGRHHDLVWRNGKYVRLCKECKAQCDQAASH